MNKIVKISWTAGLVLAIALPLALLAQSAIQVSITAPATGAEVIVGETVTFQGQATGGDTSTYQFNWTLGDGNEISSANVNGATEATHTYDTLGPKTVELRVVDLDTNLGTATITVNVVEESAETLTISNIQVSNVTQTGATITWTTNLPADSRVIYGTVSRPDISGETAPNFGYANSTATFNEASPVTGHSVTLSGLNPGTTYFFRVISRAEI